jgi:hypothetical protein
MPTIHSEPNFERCQYYDNDADCRVDRRGVRTAAGLSEI